MPKKKNPAKRVKVDPEPIPPWSGTSVMHGHGGVNDELLVQAVAERVGISQHDAAKALEAVGQVILEEVVAGNRVSLVGLGSFQSRPVRGARAAKKVEAKVVPHFQASKHFIGMVSSTEMSTKRSAPLKGGKVSTEGKAPVKPSARKRGK